MRIDPDCRDPDLLAAEVRRLRAVIDAGDCPDPDNAAKHDGSPEPTAQMPITVHAGCRSRESDAGTGDTLTDAEREAVEWCVEMAVVHATECDEEIATLRGLLERLK
jgi:hypothetical protein